MIQSPALLLEIGTEELPPKALTELAGTLANALRDGLKKRGITSGDNANVYSTPRRLTVLLPSVPRTQPDQIVERRGPAVAAGLDVEGQPTKALIGFATSCGASIEQLEKVKTDKGDWFIHRSKVSGQPTARLLPDVVAEALKALPIPKPMRWSDHEHSFVRPVHWIVLLHGTDVVDGSLIGVKCDRLSYGHRFHHSHPSWISSPETYLESLRQAKVLADPQERKQRIEAELAAAINRIKTTTGRDDLYVFTDIDLLNEVCALTEWPVAIECAFEPAFLTVPQEALIQTMQKNQKFFSVLDGKGKLTEHFIGIANIESTQPAEIRKGYERVIRPRFADAKFFYDEDRKVPLEHHCGALRSVTYQQQLGSVWDKCQRVIKLVEIIAPSLGCNVEHAVRAATLCKCDLMTRMVGEFPELQGVMGRYYASVGSTPESPEVAQALDEFYAPRYAKDAIAVGRIGQVLAVAERLDTLAGIFAIGQKPSGNKDPFALRRAALGLGRTLIEGGLNLDLKSLLRTAVELLPLTGGMLPNNLPLVSPESDRFIAQKMARGLSESTKDELVGELLEFIYERLRGYYSDQGVSSDVFDAVRVSSPLTLSDFDRRVRAVIAFVQLPESESLAAANKRISNILRQADDLAAVELDITLLEPGAESELHHAIIAAHTASEPLNAQGSYVEALQILAALREPVDAFFRDVMVMTEDLPRRYNRLALLAQLRQLFLRVADISLLQSKG